jgi:chemotaxis methyl-accepting protein methylase
MKESGFQVTSVDMVEDFGEKVVLGVDPLPEEKYDIILANYILMFLNKKERKKVLRGINANSKPGTLLMVELYPAKDGFPCEIDEIVIFFKKWKKVRKSKDRCILEKEK